MAEPLNAEHLQRLTQLDRARRGWKLVALFALSLLAVLFVCAAWTGITLRHRATAAHERAEAMRRVAEEERNQAERVRHFLENDLLREGPNSKR
jgi:hypothetical protein